MAHKTDTTLTGAAGEHLVLSRLLQRGIVAAQAPEGVRKVDILVNFLESGTPCFIQVKSRQFGSDGGWHMQIKHETVTDEDLFYCFVDFEPEQPSVHVIPAHIVADVISKDHQIWLNTPGKNGQMHKDTTMRRVIPKSLDRGLGWMDQYLEAWHLVDPGRG
jgi:hypothetical protein